MKPKYRLIEGRLVVYREILSYPTSDLSDKF